MVGFSMTPQTRQRARHEPVAPEFGTLQVSEMIGGDRRLEAGVYLSDGFVVRRSIAESSLPIKLLGDLARIWQPGRDVGVQVGPEHGVPYLAATQVFDIWPTPRKWLPPKKPSELTSLYLEPNWILVTCSGTVGRVILAYAAHAGLVVSSDLLRVEVAGDPLIRSYVYAFMRSRFGRTMMEGTHYGSIIKHLRPAHLKTIPIPMLSRATQAAIHEEVENVFALRDEAYRLDMMARASFASEMHELPIVQNEEAYSISARSFFGGRRRLEAGAYSPQSRFVAQVYEHNSESVDVLGTVARVFVPGRFKRIYGETGTTYLDSKPIFKVNPELPKFLTPATNIDFAAYGVQRGWLLMACSGQVYGINGQAILANESHEGKVITQHIMRIIPDPDRIRPGYLQTVLSHPTLGQPLVISRAFGTSVPELAPEDIERLPIPRLDDAKEAEIAVAAERASVLRYRADTIENAVIYILEDAVNEQLTTVKNQVPEKRKPGRPAKYDILNVPKIPDPK